MYFFSNLKRFRVYVFCIILVLSLFEFIFYSHYYYVHYPQVNQRDWGAGYKEVVVKTDEIRNQFDFIIVDKNLNFFPIYYNFYSSNELPKMVDVTWNKPKEWNDKKVLYVRPFYGSRDSENIIYNVSLGQKSNADIVAQFWKL